MKKILADIIERDYQDTHRSIAPLKKADDAIVVDTTSIGFHEVCEEITDLIESRLEDE